MPIFPLPPSTTFTEVTVTEQWDTAGIPSAGSVTFTATAPMVNDGKTSQRTVKAYVDANGSISVMLDANDDTGTTPVGTAYYVTVEIVGAPTYSGYLVVPHASAPTVGLDGLWVTSP
jgi:hypothetical protein